jgi:homoserine kinase type II
VLCQARVTPKAACVVGEALASVHSAPLGGLAVPEGRFGFPQIEQRLDVVRQSGRADLFGAVEELRQLAAELARSRSTNLPSGLIHGDLFRDNVLIDESGGTPRVSALLDFESACQGPYVYDLMVTVLAWCYGAELEPDLVRAMVSAYHQRRPLSPLEQQAMVLEGSVACVRFATTRLTDFSLRASPGQPPTRDFRRFLERREALAAGALDRALLGVF